MRWRLKTADKKEPVDVSLIRREENAYVFKVGSETVTLTAPEVSAFSISTDEIDLSFEVWNSKKWKASHEAKVYTIEPLSFGSSSSASLGEIRSEMPGKILKFLVKVGDKVSAQQPLVIMEAMKMENEIRAAGSGTVKTISVQAGQSVESGTVLIEIKD